MKGTWNQISFNPIITLSFLFFLIFDFQDVFAARARHFCHPEHSDAILKFKNEFQIREPCFDIYPLKTESWANNSDCCYWDGVTCDDKSGEVIKLDISRSCLHGELKTFTLQKLPFLTSLNLSRNHFNGSIPSSISNLSNLASLDFSHNNLDGEIPSSLGYLSHLTTIDISRNRIGGSFPSWIGNLPNLTSIDFSHNNLGGEIPSSLGYLSHLTSLNLSYNNLSGSIPFSIGNLSHLTTLGLSRNNFRGEIPSSLGNLVHLTILSLYRNHLVGEIPSSLGNLLHLTSLDLCCNSLDGEIPTSLGKLSNLTNLVLSDNKFVGSIPVSFGSLNELANLHGSSNKFSGSFPLALLNLTKLSFLSLSYNSFTGTLPSSLFSKPYLNTVSLEYNHLNGSLEFGNISSSSKLEKLGLGNNNFRGPIPRSISKLVHLRELDLSNLNTQDSVDISIFSHLNSLQYLDISYLNTTTTIDLNAILSCLKSLDTLDLQGNHVSATNKSSVSNLTSVLLSTLYLKGCSITEFPDILRTQLALTFLDISNNKMKGQVPGWLWMLPFLQYVNLSNNTFIGFERSSVSEPAIRQLFGSNNRFTGNIPSFLCMFPFLSTLDLSKNNFSGSIPRCMGYLQALNLGHNRLSGHLPEDIFESLRSLDVSHNQLAGKLPKSLIRNSFLTVLNVASNKINDTFPFWLSSLQELQVLVLRANAFHGPIQQTQFTKLQIIDISHNHFNGHFPPDCFMNWTAMFFIEEKEDESIGRKDDQTKKEVMHLAQTKYMGADYYYYDSIVIMNKGVALEVVRILKFFVAIDFSGNKFEGEIPSSIGLLKELRVLNLSNNAFTSHIPSTMGNLTELESLDVSQNKLSGEIPQELGKLSYLAYMDFSHNLLVGLVPGGTQFRRQLCSSFEDNQGLYGPSLDEVCGNIHEKTSQQFETPEPEKDEEEVLSWIAAALGFVPGVFFGLTMGYMLVYYKLEWFMKPFGRNKQRSTITTTY